MCLRQTAFSKYQLSTFSMKTNSASILVVAWFVIEYRYRKSYRLLTIFSIKLSNVLRSWYGMLIGDECIVRLSFFLSFFVSKMSPFQFASAARSILCFEPYPSTVTYLPTKCMLFCCNNDMTFNQRNSCKMYTLAIGRSTFPAKMPIYKNM